MHIAPAIQNEDDQFISCKAVMADTGLGKSTIYRMVREGRFPKPAHIGKASRWSRRRVQAWMREQFADSAA